MRLSENEENKEDYIVICFIPNQCFFYWDGQSWSASGKDKRKYNYVDARAIFKARSHRRLGLSKKYTVQLVRDSDNLLIDVREGS